MSKFSSGPCWGIGSSKHDPPNCIIQLLERSKLDVQVGSSKSWIIQNWIIQVGVSKLVHPPWTTQLDQCNLDNPKVGPSNLDHPTWIIQLLDYPTWNVQLGPCKLAYPNWSRASPRLPRPSETSRSLSGCPQASPGLMFPGWPRLFPTFRPPQASLGF
jgi:hypothetical protein